MHMWYFARICAHARSWREFANCRFAHFPSFFSVHVDTCANDRSGSFTEPPAKSQHTRMLKNSYVEECIACSHLSFLAFVRATKTIVHSASVIFRCDRVFHSARCHLPFARPIAASFLYPSQQTTIRARG